MSVIFSARLSEARGERADRCAAERGIDRSRFITLAIEELLNGHGPEDIVFVVPKAQQRAGHANRRPPPVNAA
ncbi:MAG: hypothetical protein ACXVS6_19225 [Solirubrobacteraceae bacterium]